MTQKARVYIAYLDADRYTESKLGSLTIEQVLALQKQIAKISPRHIKCPNYINACLEYATEVARNTKMSVIPDVRYTILATFKYHDDVAKCCQKYTLRNGAQMTKMCAHNLRCGKCKDEFIRRTLGAALFPQFYAKDKQK